MTKNRSKSNSSSWSNITKFVSIDYLKSLVWDPRQVHVACFCLLIVEVVANVFVIENVKYTEIDWSTYMQTVEGFINGTLDYKRLGGSTGPIQYPAGYVYVYSVFYHLTDRGTNIRLAQYIFLALYIVQLMLAFRIYVLTAKVPPIVLVLCTLTSYRIHSIFVLRLFNDPIAVILFYAALNLFVSDKWILGSVLFSLGVSVKMNVLLYAPCLLVAYLTNLSLRDAFLNLLVCGSVQLILGAPFLITYPLHYLELSFNLGRVFEHKWTVNYRFLDVDVFESRSFHIGLLVLHAILLLVFLPPTLRYLSSYAKLNTVTNEISDDLRRGKHRQKKDGKAKSIRDEATDVRFCSKAQLLVLPFFVTNLIGIACARSLHYQFYCWYFHSLPYLVYSTGFGGPLKFLLLAVIELCWNTYPSTSLSSLALHATDIVLLIGTYKYMKH